MSISAFTKALRDKANSAVQVQAQKSLDQLLSGSIALLSIDPETGKFDPFAMRSGASILSKGKIEKRADDGKIVKKNLTDTFRDVGEMAGNTALPLTGDILEQLLKTLNVVPDNKGTAIELYIKYLLENHGNSYVSKDWEFYLEDKGNPSGVYKKVSQDAFTSANMTLSQTVDSIGKDRIRSLRGLNFSHERTVEHLAGFILSLRKGPTRGTANFIAARKAVMTEINSKFQKGHLIAQSTGRGKLSTAQVEDITFTHAGKTYNGNPLKLLVELSERIDKAALDLGAQNAELQASINKSYNVINPKANVTVQLTKSDGGKLGNQDIGNISTSLALVGTLQRLIQNAAIQQERADYKEADSTKASLAGVPTTVSVEQYAKELDKFLEKLGKEGSALYDKINKVLAATNDTQFLVDLQASDTFNDFIGNSVNHLLKTGKNIKPQNTQSPKVSLAKMSVAKPNLPKLATQAKAFKQKVEALNKKAKSAAAKQVIIEKMANKTVPTSSINLLVLINAQLAQRIKENMGSGNRRDILNLRTGRFAESVKVERLSESRAGMITAFYTYMRNPYATFSEGGRQESPRSRDPKLLISKTIREIAQTRVQNRLRAVLV